MILVLADLEFCVISVPVVFLLGYNQVEADAEEPQILLIGPWNCVQPSVAPSAIFKPFFKFLPKSLPGL